MKRLSLLALLAACGFQPISRENPPIPPDGLGPYREVGALALCQDGVALAATGPAQSGFCVPDDAPAPDACTSDDACGTRERCLCGRCVVPFCTGNESCRAGESCILGSSQCGITCALDEDCAGGAACDRGRCAERCSEASECQRGESCSRLRGVCVAIACSEGAGCAADERCEPQTERRTLAEPAVVERDGQLILFVADLDAGAILRGRGVRIDAFEIDRAPLLEDARGPAPVVDGDDLVLYFARADRGALSRVSGADGEPGVIEEVLVPEHAWEGGVVDAPSAVVQDGRVILAYEGAGGIGVALEDGGSWTGRDEPAVTSALLEDPLLWREVGSVGSPMLLSDDTALGAPRLRMWVDARGAEGAATVVGDEVVPPPRNDSVGTLLSLDGGETFLPAPFNPTFARVAELGRYKAESDPWVLHVDDEYRLWFVGADVEEGTPEGLGVAVSSR